MGQNETSPIRVRLLFSDGSTADYDVIGIDVETIEPVLIQADGYGFKIMPQED